MNSNSNNLDQISDIKYVISCDFLLLLGERVKLNGKKGVIGRSVGG